MQTRLMEPAPPSTQERYPRIQAPRRLLIRSRIQHPGTAPASMHTNSANLEPTAAHHYADVQAANGQHWNYEGHGEIDAGHHLPTGEEV